MLQKLKKNKLYANQTNSEFASLKMDFLGHVLPQEGVRPDPKKIESIKEWQSPALANGVRSFLGLPNVYIKFIKDFSALAKPLANPLKKQSELNYVDVLIYVMYFLKMHFVNNNFIPKTKM
jgi:hypothetical protein